MSNFVLILIGLLLPFAPVHAVLGESTKSAGLSVTSRVAAQGEHILFDFKNDKTSAIVGADEEITYTVTYGSLLSYGTPMRIEADWSLGTVPDQSLYSYNILTYVAGSATRDYWGESTPTVDLVNRKITWIVNRFPPNTIGKTLSFKLRTPGRYVTDRNVNFTVRARLIQDDVTKGWINLDNTYSPTEFIRKELRGLHILSADIKRITDHSFSIFVVTSQPTRTVIYYGLSPDNLDQTLSDNELSDQKLITIDGLTPATTYYYRILVENASGIQRKTPEVFQVTTSSISLLALLDQERVIVSTRGVLLTGLKGIGPDTSIVVPRSVPVEFYLPFISGVPASLSISLSPKALSLQPKYLSNVLGITTEEAPVTGNQRVRFLETQPKTYSGTITSPRSAGLYDILMEAEGDLTGANRDLLATLVVSDPITVRDSQGQPIEHALVYIERLDQRSGKYVYFPAATYGSHNPSYTDSDGSVPNVLPAGDYSLNVNAPGYETYQKKFAFNPSDRQPYPQIALTTARFQQGSYVAYYWAVATDLITLANWNIDKLASSWRYLNTSILVSVFLMTVLSLFANLRRIRVSAEGFLVFAEKTMLRMFHRPRPETMFYGFVQRTDTQSPVHGAVALLTDKKTRKEISRDITGTLGSFRLRLEPGKEYELTIRKNGFEMTKALLPPDILLVGHEPFLLKPEVPLRYHPLIDFFRLLLGSVFHAVSDTLLFTVGILNLLVYLRLGAQVLPIMVLTALNALLWLEYEWHQYQGMKAELKRKNG